jgi:hypothetical protein
MTNATKTLALVFAGSLVLAFATSWQWDSASSAAFQEEVLPVDTSAVHTVRIASPDRPTLRLTRSTGGWVVSSADTAATYPASPDAVGDLLRSVPGLAVAAVATRRPEKHPRYGVDSTGTTLTLLDASGERLGALVLGRTQFRDAAGGGSAGGALQRRRRTGTTSTDVRPPEQPDVYAVEASLRSFSAWDLTGWRDKRLWSVSRAQVQRIDFSYPADSSFAIRRVAAPDTAATPAAWVSAGDTLSQRRVSPLLRVLTAPRADAFAEALSPSDLQDAPYTLRLHLADGTQRTLRLSPAPAGSFYRAAADEYPYVAELRDGAWDDSVLQGRSTFLSDD